MRRVYGEITHQSGQEQDINAGIAVKVVDYVLALGGGHAAIQPQVSDAGQVSPQQIVLHYVQHGLQLTEDQSPMLAHRLCLHTNAAVEEELPAGRINK